MSHILKITSLIGEKTADMEGVNKHAKERKAHTHTKERKEPTKQRKEDRKEWQKPTKRERSTGRKEQTKKEICQYTEHYLDVVNRA